MAVRSDRTADDIPQPVKTDGRRPPPNPKLYFVPPLSLTRSGGGGGQALACTYRGRAKRGDDRALGHVHVVPPWRASAAAATANGTRSRVHACVPVAEPEPTTRRRRPALPRSPSIESVAMAQVYLSPSCGAASPQRLQHEARPTVARGGAAGGGAPKRRDWPPHGS